MSEHHSTPDARLFRMEGRMTELVTVGLLPEGLRMHNSFEGTIVAGELAGARVSGIDEFVIRPDGVGSSTLGRSSPPRPAGCTRRCSATAGHRPAW